VNRLEVKNTFGMFTIGPGFHVKEVFSFLGVSYPI
jgi:hypothetical protein